MNVFAILLLLHSYNESTHAYILNLINIMLTQIAVASLPAIQSSLNCANHQNKQLISYIALQHCVCFFFRLPRFDVFVTKNLIFQPNQCLYIFRA